MGCSKDSSASLTAVRRGVQSLLFAMLFAGGSAALAQTLTLTPEQIAQLQALSDEERAALFSSATGQTGSATQAPVTNPVVVEPRDVRPAQSSNSAILDNAVQSGQAQQRDLDEQFTPLSAGQPAQPATDQADAPGASAAERVERAPLQQFGYELFAGTPTTFAPATDIPVPADYVMGPGDTVVIQLYGQRNITHELVVTREGMLMFPEIGPVAVTGLSFGELREQIQTIVATQLIGQNASVTMGALRSINVFVLGEAFRPGSYTVSSLSTMTNALFVSGGVTTVGSLRSIRLMRAGQLVTELDLYDLLLRGDTSGDARLQPGDVIFIPPIGQTVGISGEVKRPAIFELRTETTAAEALALTGGFLPTAFPRASRIERINEQGERTLMDADLSAQAASTPALVDGDIIVIASVLDQIESVVMLEGHVSRPGGFQWRQGLRVSDVLPRVTDMLPNPDLDYALIARETQPTRRVELLYVNLGQAIANPGSAADLVFEPRDQLHTFGASQNRQDQLADLIERLRDQASFEQPPLIVEVRGNVRFPGEYPLVRNMSLNDAISFAGGLGANSNLQTVLIERQVNRSGSITLQSAELDPLSLQTAAPVMLREQDTIVVFNANEPREDLLAPTLEKLRAQASASEPTRIVNITGSVRFPGSYPLLDGLTVERLIALAGGLSESAERRNAEITRYDAELGQGREVGHVAIDLQNPGSDGANFALAPFDQLVIRQMPNWTDNEFVDIEGEVNAPGRYSITKEDTLASLIARAGGLTAYAEPRAAIFLREELRENEQRMLEEFRDRLERDILTRNLQQTNNEEGAQQTTAGITELLDRIAEVNAVGRLVVDLPRVLEGDTRSDVILRTGDRLLIPRTQQEVSVIGEVNRPTSHLYERGRNVSDYIASSGGFTSDADNSGVYVIRASGEVVAVGSARWFFEEREGLLPGDSIVVPFDAYQPSALYVWRNVSQILFNISTTLLAIERVGQ
jgi:polysaccharide export outer membrane protein